MIEFFNRHRFRGILAAAVLALSLAAPVVVRAGDVAVVPMPTIPRLPNMIGFGVGTTPDFVGAKSNYIGVAPFFRYQFGESERNVFLLGPLASFNLVNDKNWHAGPLLRYRSGRSDADNAVIASLHDIGATVEAGAFVSYQWYGKGAVPWRIHVSANLLQGFNSADGTRLSLGGNIMLPLSRWALVSVGGSLSFTDAKTMQGYFGITTADSANSGLPVYEPGGGLSNADLWMGLSFLIGRRWILGGGIYWQRLRGNAADSPWVSQEGDVNQVSYGVGLVYFWN